jgi:RNA polymerase sigma-70 factor (ECF subfamily)
MERGAALAGTSEENAGEPELLARLRAGDPQAFEHLVRTYAGRLLAVARRLLRDEEDARDAVQEALLSAFKALPRFQGGSQISTWLHRIVVNAALMRLRSRRHEPEVPAEDLMPRFLEDGHRADPERDWSLDVHQRLEREEVRARVRRCIDQLPETYRTVLILRDIEEMDTAQAARVLGVSENAVKIRLHRSRQALRTLLTRTLGA